MSWWNMFIPLGAWFFASTASGINLQFFAPIRMFTWPLYKKMLVDKLNAANPLMAYPLIIWMEFEGRTIFLKNGWFVFVKAYTAQGEKVIEGLTVGIQQIADQLGKQ